MCRSTMRRNLYKFTKIFNDVLSKYPKSGLGDLFFLDIETFYQALSTCQFSGQFNHPNRNYGGGQNLPSPGHTNLQIARPVQG